MITRNAYRKDKISEVARIWETYPDLYQPERLYMVIIELSRRAIQLRDHTQLASLAEIAIVVQPLFINLRTKKPLVEGINWVRRLMTWIKRDEGHRHIRPYVEPHVEKDVHGREVVRNYVNLLMGAKLVNLINGNLEREKNGIKDAQRLNRDLVNVKRVLKEADLWAKELEAKQNQANLKKRRNKGSE